MIGGYSPRPAIGDTVRFPKTNWGVDKNATPDLLAIIAALPATGGVIELPRGVGRFTAAITVDKPIILRGHGLGTNASEAQRGGTILLKEGAFDGVTLTGQGAGLEGIQVDGVTGNTGDGVVVAAGRVRLDSVSVTNQGRDGIRIGTDAGVNCNGFTFTHIICLNNGRHGLYADDPSKPTVPDITVGTVMGLDTRGNAGDGLLLGASLDCSWYGVHSQFNAGWGMRVAANAKGHHFFAFYEEANVTGKVLFEAGANYNFYWGTRAGETADGVTDQGTGNFILGRDSQFGPHAIIRTPLIIPDLYVRNKAVSGAWHLRQLADTNRTLEVILEGTSQNPVDAAFKHAVAGSQVRMTLDQLRFGTGTYIKRHLTAGATLNFGTVAAGGTAEATLTMAGAVASDEVVASPQSGGLPTGIVFGGAYVSAADTVKVRVGNITAASIVSQQAWKINVWGH